MTHGIEKNGITSSVQSVERALDLLEVLGRTEGELGVSDIGTATGLSVGTVHRLLGTLVARGYAQRNPATRKYGLGLKSIAVALAARERVGPLAAPFLRELMERSSETANLAVLEGRSAVYIGQVTPPSRTLRIFTEIGARVPMNSTGAGKVLIAYQPKKLMEFLIGIEPLPRQTYSTITDPSQFEEELELVRERDYAVDYEEHEEGVRCVAAPVFGQNGEVFAAVSVSGPASRMSSRRIEEIVPDLKDVATRLSDALGTL